MKQALKCDFTWADFKTNSDGMVPVVVQDAENASSISAYIRITVNGVFIS